MAKKGHHMAYPKEAEAKLKEANRLLRAEVKRLKKRLNEEYKRTQQLENALSKNFEHVTDMMGDISLEDALRMANKKAPKPKEDTKQMIRERYRNMFKRSDKDD